MKKILLIIIPAFYFMFFVSGCANTELISDIDPTANLSDLKTFYVAKFGPDKRGIETMIAKELNDMGYKATSGDQSVPPQQVDAIVSYQDKWMWDLSNYMIELTIDFRDPQTNYKFATGRSYRTSFARRSPEEMVKEVLGKIFGVQ